MDQNTGRYIIYGGIVIVIAGVIIYFFHDKLNWLGKLPGDIRIENEHAKFYFPVVTMIIVSIVLTLLINIIRKWF